MQTITEKRLSLRYPAVFPVQLSETNLAETVDVSDSGLCLSLENPLSPGAIVNVSMDIPLEESFKTKAKVIWTAKEKEENRYKCGMQFVEIEANQKPAIKESVGKYNILDPVFVRETQKMRRALVKIKNLFDELDLKDLRGESEAQIEKMKDSIFNFFTYHFNSIWDMVENIPHSNYGIYQKYYQKMLGPLLLDPVETNNYIYKKPLGYAGDYMMMLYIYEYNKGKYLGATSYSKLVNNYTCNIPISLSNIRRKEYFKEKILECIRLFDKPKILSVACGPARELTEIIEEGLLEKNLFYDCFDMEEKALEHVFRTISEIEEEKRGNLTIRYVKGNVIDIARRKIPKEFEERNYNLIYCSGVFDYLRWKIAGRLIAELFEMLSAQGKLIICNASLDNQSHRAYYEMLGEWEFYHRKKSDIMEWTKAIKGHADIQYENDDGTNNYIYLSITKK